MGLAGSTYFQSYQTALQRLMFAEMLDEHLQAQRQRRLSIVGPCLTHEQWLAVQSERRAASPPAAPDNAPPAQV